MLGQGISTDRQIRIDALKNQLVERAGNRRGPLFDALNRRLQQTASRQVLVLQDAFSGLPTAVAGELLADMEPKDLANITEPSRIPLQLRERARASLQAIRTTRAYEGLFLDLPYGADTERLALHSLQALPDWPENVRIEIRELFIRRTVARQRRPGRCRTSAESWSARTVSTRRAMPMIFTCTAPTIFMRSVLHALPDAERNALGYHINQGATLKHAIQKAPLPRDTCSALLADNPCANRRTIPSPCACAAACAAVLRGASSHGQLITPQERVRVVRPGWTEAEALAYLRAGGSEVSLEQRASALEAEFNRLNANFQRLAEHSDPIVTATRPLASPNGSPATRYTKQSGKRWQQTGLRDVDSFGELQGSVLDLQIMPMGRHLETMPTLEGNFDHVTRLNLSSTGLTDAPRIASSTIFPACARSTSTAIHSRELPNAISRMGNLAELNLRGNRIVLDAQGIADLGGLTRLRGLDLVGNPLREVPDISRMSMVHTLILLADTGIRYLAARVCFRNRGSGIFTWIFNAI